TRRGLSVGVDDRDEAALAAPPESDHAVARREDRVVLADTRAGARAEARAALADEDHPGRHVLAREHLHAKHLRVRVAAVAGRAGTSALVFAFGFPAAAVRAPAPVDSFSICVRLLRKPVCFR